MMKRILVLIFGIAVAGMAYAQTATTSKPTGPVITWEKSTHDFGDMQQGDNMTTFTPQRSDKSSQINFFCKTEHYFYGV